MHSLVHNKLSKMQMQRGGANQDYMLPNVPNDGVSNIAFGVMNNTTLLASSSWCGQVGVWLVYNNGSAESGGFISHDGPALGCDVDSQNGVVYSAGADGKVKAWDVVAKQDVVVGEHKGPVRSVKYLPDMSCLVSGGWDKSYKVWDIRAGSMVMDANLPDDVFAMDLQDQVGVFAIGPKGIAVYDMRNAQNPLKSFDSPHELQTKSVAVMKNQLGYAYGSIEGRVQIDYFGNKEQDSFPFRCHRIVQGNNSTQPTEAYAVNSIAFHPVYNTMATSGADGNFVFWDHAVKNRIKQFNRMDNTISCTAFSNDGLIFAYASSYDWSKGANSDLRQKPNLIYLHSVLDDEVRSKAQQQAPQQQQQQQQQQGGGFGFGRRY